jgi:alpha-1,2-mannosyltransferase
VRARPSAWAIALAALAGAVAGALAGGFPDLDVYRHGGGEVLAGRSPYASDDPVYGYPFTYPPFAALAMVPLALPPGWVAAALWTALSAGCLAAAVVLVSRQLAWPAAPWLVVVACAAAVALEPVWQNYAFGQINLILMLAILTDLVRPERRWAGVALGVVAGIKLTPLVFVVLLVLIGYRAAALRAVIVFAATIAVGWLAVPGAASYWSERLLDPRRVGPPSLAHNQSVSGVLTRLLDEPPSTLLWMAVAGPIALATVFIAAAWWRRGDRVLGACLGALAMLLASPVSWSHHWVWAVPLALALWPRSRTAAILWTAVFVARPILWPPWAERREYAWRWYEQIYGNGYVIATLVVIGYLTWGYAVSRSQPPKGQRPVP